MKKVIFSLFALCAVLATISCKKEDKPTPTPVVQKTELKNGDTLTGTLTQNLTIPEGNYKLKGVVEVNDGVTLTISAGATFTVPTAFKDLTNILVIKQGAKIMAQGNATKPIVFTSETKSSGAWGGIILLGKAKINAAGGTAKSEAGQYPYGGTDDADNSGILSYVRIEYAGSQVADGKSEYNAFSFFSVGSGTKLEYLEAYKGADDGFEFYGGKVQANYLIAIDCEDDSFDWDQGFTGGGNNWIAQQDANGDNGLEASNAPVEFETATPVARPVITGLTITRKALKSGAANGIIFKDGTGGELSNVKIAGVTVGITIGDSATAKLVISDPNRLKMSKVNIGFASGATGTKRISYKQVNSPTITDFPPADDATATGSSDTWVSDTWVVGYVK